MVAMFFVVLILIVITSRPATWARLFPDDAGAKPGAQTTPAAEPAARNRPAPAPRPRSTNWAMGALIVLACAWFAWRTASFSRKLFHRDRPEPDRPRRDGTTGPPPTAPEAPSGGTTTVAPSSEPPSPG
jgi:hypothetical protein